MKRKYEIAVLSKGAFARTVRIYAPKKADRAIIMHDGQNVFYDEEATYKKSWRVLDILKNLEIKNTAIIGIDSTITRDYDYLAFPPEIEQYKGRRGGGAQIYADYIQDIIIPYLDKRFGFKTYGMLGSSFGSLITLYFAARQNPRVTAYGLFSSPMFVCRSAYDKFLSESAFRATDKFTVYVGGDECSSSEPSEREKQLYVDDSFTITNALRRAGVRNIKLTVNNTGIHDEISWREPATQLIKDFSQL